MLHWGVYFIIVSVVFRTLGTIDIGGFTLNQSVIILLLLAAIPYRLIKERRFYRFATLDLALVIFGIYLWLSNYLVSPDPSWGWRVATDYLRSLTCYFLVVFLITDEKKVKWFVLTYIAASMAMVLTADLFGIFQAGMGFHSRGREGLTGGAGHYINYAIYALMSIPLVYFSIKSYRSVLIKMVLWGVLAVLSLAVLFSGSRGAVLSFALMTVLIIWFEVKHFSQIKPLQLSALIVCSAGLIAAFWIKGGSEIIVSLFTVGAEGATMDAALAGRLNLNKSSLSLFYDNSLFGIGTDATRNILGNVTHNQWLQIMTELGCLGIGLALVITWILVSYFVSARSAMANGHRTFLRHMLDGAAISSFTLLAWGFYENIGYINAEKVLFMLFALVRVIKTMESKKRSVLRSHPINANKMNIPNPRSALLKIA